MSCKFSEQFKKCVSQASQGMLRDVLLNAAPAASLLSLGGNFALAARAGLDFNFESLAGVCFICAAALFWKVKKNPYYFKIAGGLIIAAGASLAVGAYGQSGFWAQVGGALPVIVSGALLVLGGMKIGTLRADRDADRPNRKMLCTVAKGALKDTFGRYPVVASALINLTANGMLLCSACQRGDEVMMGICSMWSVGAILMACSDPSVQNSLHAKSSYVQEPVFDKVAENAVTRMVTISQVEQARERVRMQVLEG